MVPHRGAARRVPDGSRSEAACFDVGYEHGRAAGRTEMLAEGKSRAALAYRTLAQQVREAAVNAGIPHTQATAALLEAAWALAFVDGSSNGDTSRRR